MTGDRTLHEAVEQSGATTTEIKTELATQTTLLRGIDDVLKDVLKAVTPDDTADPGVPLDELLARLIVELREHGKKLDIIMRLLQGSKPGGGDKSGAAARPNGAR
jgi:hypothetical protein